MKWISVKERLPKENEIILIYNDDSWNDVHQNRFCIAKLILYDNEQGYIYCECNCYGPVKGIAKFWMPLPALPKE